MKKLFYLLVASALVMASCGPSSRIVRSWRNPASTGSELANGKVLIIGLVKDESSRRIVEDNLANLIGQNAVQSYTLFSERTIRESKDDLLEQHLGEQGFTHLIMVRLTEIEKETNFVPGTMGMGGMGMMGMGGMGMGGFYGMGPGMWGAGMWGTPGHYRTDKNYFMETGVYSINPGNLMWSGTTKTVNPSKMSRHINDVAKAVIREMERDGFLQKK
jgi:hypothetical protein